MEVVNLATAAATERPRWLATAQALLDGHRVHLEHAREEVLADRQQELLLADLGAARDRLAQVRLVRRFLEHLLGAVLALLVGRTAGTPTYRLLRRIAAAQQVIELGHQVTRTPAIRHARYSL